MIIRRHTERRTKFSDFSPAQRAALVALGATQVGLLLAAEVDIQRRPDDQVAGRKLWWRAVCLINIIGPLSYFRWGRRSAQAPSSRAASDRGG